MSRLAFAREFVTSLSPVERNLAVKTREASKKIIEAERKKKREGKRKKAEEKIQNYEKEKNRLDRLAEKFKGDHKLANYVKQEKNRIDSKLAHQKVLKRSYEKGNRFGRVDRGMSAFASATLQVARNVTARLTHPFSCKKCCRKRLKA